MALTAEQIEMRRTGVGGSDIAAVVGLSPWSGPLDVWREKVEGWAKPLTPAMEQGTLMEEVVAELYRRRTGAVLRMSTTLRHPVCSIALATPDRIATYQDGTERLIEFKVSRYADGYGQPGTDEVPVHHMLQVQWSMFVTGYKSAHLALLVPGDELRIFCIETDADIQAMLVQKVEEFWAQYVVPKTAPEPDGSQSTTEWLKERFPASRAPVVHATPEAEEWAARYQEARAHCEEWQKSEDEAAQHLKMLIAEAAGMEGAGWKASWKQEKDRTTVDFKSVLATIHPDPKIIEKYTSTAPGRRPFKFTTVKDSREAA